MKTYRSVQDILIALTADIQLDIGGITRRNIGLGHQESRTNLAFQQGSQPLLFLSIIAVLGQYLHVTSIRGSVIGSLGGNLALAQKLGHEAILEICEAGALVEVVLGEKHVPQTELLSLLLQLLHHDGGGLPSLLAFA